MINEEHHDIYDAAYREDLSDNDEIEPFEDAFMRGYGEAL